MASQEVFDVMLSCWNVTPETRPSFNELEKTFGLFMGKDERDVSNKVHNILININETVFILALFST